MRRFHPARSLRNRIRWLILLPLIAVGVLAVSAFLVLTDREIENRTSQDVRAASQSFASILAEKQQHLALSTKLVADLPHIKEAVLHADRSTAGDDLRWELSSRLIDADGLIYFDRAGQVYALEGTSASDVAALSTQLQVGLALDENTSWSGLVRSPGKLILAATEPLMVGEYPQGALVCYSFVDSKMAAQLKSGDATEVALMSHGKVTASSRPIQGLVTAGPRVHARINGTEYVGLYSTLPGRGLGTDIGFVVLRRLDDIVSPSRGFLIAFLTVLIPALAGAGLWANRFSKRITGPLDEVVQAASEMEQGRWPERFEVVLEDEIGVLQGAFNRMSEALQAHEKKLRAMIDIDPLTELANHRKLKEMLSAEIAGSYSHGRPLSLVLFDIDHFSDFNRAKGLLAGDEVLRQFAQLLLENAPAAAHVARYGGEEFALLLPNCDLRESLAIAESVRKIFRMAHASHGLTSSVGCAELAPGTDRPESLALAAELALTKAKQLGRDQVCDFSAVGGGDGVDPRELNRFLQDGTLATIQALAAAVDAKDPYTKGHSQRVAEYATELCRFIGGTEQEAELVFRTGTLHDVGKIGVADHILKKAGPLTPEERALMETHPVLGEIIVKKVPQLADTLPGVRHHHERWDGKGYPDGLVGENIPRLARILAIADTFDAMTSDRPYRKGMAEDVALGEIERGGGSQFDPEIARAFVRLRSGTARRAAQGCRGFPAPFRVCCRWR